MPFWNSAKSIFSDQIYFCGLDRTEVIEWDNYIFMAYTIVQWASLSIFFQNAYAIVNRSFTGKTEVNHVQINCLSPSRNTFTFKYSKSAKAYSYNRCLFFSRQNTNHKANKIRNRKEIVKVELNFSLFSSER